MTNPQDEEDDRPPTKEEEIEELKGDLANSIRWKKAYDAPITAAEAGRRARDRMFEPTAMRLMLVVIIAAFAGPFFIEIPYASPLPMIAAAAALIYAAFFIWESRFAEQAQKTWRARRARECLTDIGEIRNELYRLGVRDQDLPNELR